MAAGQRVEKRRKKGQKSKFLNYCDPGYKLSRCMRPGYDKYNGLKCLGKRMSRKEL